MVKELVLILLSLLVCVAARADYASQHLAAGMSFSEVSSLKGQPQEIEDRESLREVVWHYADDNLVFKQGKLLHWKLQNEFSYQAPIRADENSANSSLKPKELSHNSFFSVDRQAQKKGILSEIMKELPSDENPAPSPPGPGLPGVSPVEIVRQK